MGTAIAILAAALTSTATADESTDLEGRIRVGIEGISLSDVGAAVVFMEPENPALTDAAAIPPAIVRQQGAQFEPNFLVVSVGQLVQMPNDDIIYHNVFSYSDPNDFDLGMYAAGETEQIRFEQPGLVRIYCSIHEDMDGLIFVAPSRLFAVPEPDGRFRIPDVPTGRYRLRVWSERMPEIERSISVAPPATASIDLVLGGEQD